jgi:hypothetical protein
MSDSTWYVSYQRLGPHRGPQGRLFETFSNELNAKKFVKARHADATLPLAPSTRTCPNE